MIVGSEISKELRMMGHGEHNQSGIKTKYKHWTVIMIMMTMIDDDNGRWWWLFNHKNHFPGLVLDLALMMKRTQRRRFFLHISPSFILISTILTSSLLLFLKSKPGEWLPGSRNRRSQHRSVEDRALQKVLPHVQGQRNWGDCLSRRWWTSKTSDLLKSKTSSCKTLFETFQNVNDEIRGDHWSGVGSSLSKGHCWRDVTCSLVKIIEFVCFTELQKIMQIRNEICMLGLWEA